MAAESSPSSCACPMHDMRTSTRHHMRAPVYTKLRHIKAYWIGCTPTGKRTGSYTANAEVLVIARDARQAKLKCPESVPPRAATSLWTTYLAEDALNTPSHLSYWCALNIDDCPPCRPLIPLEDWWVHVGVKASRVLICNNIASCASLYAIRSCCMLA
eukprot:6214729-Pleurochrysis_carterae.AAC.3